MFNYICEECRKGMVRPKEITDYETKIDGYPFIVAKATVGICDECGAEYINAKEWQRWKELYLKGLEATGKFLGREEIAALRKKLGLTMGAFAQLIGCTRQSVYNWERSDRIGPQSRMGDLLMKLLVEALKVGQVNVLEFLASEARKMGVEVRLRRSAQQSERLLEGVSLGGGRPGYGKPLRQAEDYDRIFGTQKRAHLSPSLRIVH